MMPLHYMRHEIMTNLLFSILEDHYSYESPALSWGFWSFYIIQRVFTLSMFSEHLLHLQIVSERYLPVNPQTLSTCATG